MESDSTGDAEKEEGRPEQLYFRWSSDVAAIIRRAIREEMDEASSDEESSAESDSTAVLSRIMSEESNDESPCSEEQRRSCEDATEEQRISEGSGEGGRGGF